MKMGHAVNCQISEKLSDVCSCGFDPPPQRAQETALDWLRNNLAGRFISLFNLEEFVPLLEQRDAETRRAAMAEQRDADCREFARMQEEILAMVKAAHATTSAIRAAASPEQQEE